MLIVIIFFGLFLVDVFIGLVFVVWWIEFEVVYIGDYVFFNIWCIRDYYMLCDFICFYVFGIVIVLVVNGK